MANAAPKSLKAVQQAFTAYIRDPEHAPLPPGVEKKRMAMYRELFFNNIDSFLSNGFPVLKRILRKNQWQNLVEDFFARHVCTTPYFPEIAEEFLAYLQTQPPLLACYPPFLLELAHYEWVEIALANAQEDAPVPDNALIDHPENYPLALSPLTWPLAYRYPVQRLSPQYQPQTPPEQATYLAVFRDCQFEVRFLEITLPAFVLLQTVQEQPGIYARQCLQILATANPVLGGERLCESGLKLVKDMATLGILCQHHTAA